MRGDIYIRREGERGREGQCETMRQCDRNKNREKFRCVCIESRDGGNDSKWTRMMAGNGWNNGVRSTRGKLKRKGNEGDGMAHD